MTDSSLWVLFFSLFLIVVLIMLHTVLQACLIFAYRYCVCVQRGRCCCYFRIDWETHRREREHLRRLRALRQMHREIILGELSTFTQIPGAVPDSHNFGFILVSEAPQRPIREQLTSDQRKNILNRLLTFEPYTPGRSASSQVSVEERHDDPLESPSDLELNERIQQENSVTQPQSRGNEIRNETLSIAIPAHEEPINQNTCAICLDEFLEGELINQSTECQHFFHKDCLLGWLEQHDVCPCCRRNMVTEQDWKRELEASRLHEREHGGRGCVHG